MLTTLTTSENCYDGIAKDYIVLYCTHANLSLQNYTNIVHCVCFSFLLPVYGE